MSQTLYTFQKVPHQTCKIKYVAVSPVRTFTNETGVEHQLVTCGIAPSTEVMKANVYYDNIPKMKPGRTMILKVYSLNRETLVIKVKAKL